MKFKKIIQQYWERNVPGLDVGLSKGYLLYSKEFYLEVDKNRFVMEPYIPKLINTIVENGKRLLEVGCGIGYDLREFSRRGMEVFGIDLSFKNTLLTKKGLDIFNLKGYVVTADAENLPFKDNSFDLVYSFGVLHHTPDTQKAIDEIYRVLKTGGKCIIGLYHTGIAYYYIMIIHGFLSGRIFYMTKEQILSRYYDNTPLSKIYSTREAKKFFRKFDNIKIEYATFGGIRNNKYFKWLWYTMLICPFLIRLLGSFIIIKAEKL